MKYSIMLLVTGAIIIALNFFKTDLLFTPLRELIYGWAGGLLLGMGIVGLKKYKYK